MLYSHIIDRNYYIMRGPRKFCQSVGGGGGGGATQLRKRSFCVYFSRYGAEKIQVPLKAGAIVGPLAKRHLNGGHGMLAWQLCDFPVNPDPCTHTPLWIRQCI